MDSFYQGIELAVKATGAQAVADLEAHVRMLKSQLQGMQAQLQAGATTTVEAAEQMGELAQKLRQAEEAAKRANDSLQGVATAANEAGKAGGYGAMKWMLLGNAIQDAQYGFSAIVNNIPQLTLAFGGSAGLAGIIGIAGVAVQQLIGHFDQLRSLFEMGVPPKLINDLGEVEKELKRLTEKEWKTAIDFRDIDLLQKKTEDLSKAEAAYQRLKSGKTEAQEKRSRVVSEAITESGGVDVLQQTVEGLTAPTDSEETTKKKAQIAQLDQRIAADSKAVEARGGSVRDIMEAQYNELMRWALVIDRDAAKGELRDLQGADANNRNRGVKELIGAASAGDENARGKLKSLLDANEGKFAKQGIDTSRLGAGLENASPANLFADEREKHGQEMAAKAAKAQKERQDEALRIQASQDRVNAEDRKRRDDKAARMREAEEDAAKDVEDYEKEAKRDKDKADKEAPKVAAKVREARYSRMFRQANPDANQAQADTAAREIDGLVQKGASPQQAYASVRQKMLTHLQEMTRQVLEMRAQQEQDNGFFGQASQMLMEFNAKIRMMSATQGRGQTQMRSFMPTYGGM